MNSRQTTQDLAKAISGKTEIKQRDVDSFLKALITLLTDEIELKGPIEIKGLGVFKLTPIEGRESIHVNTGERFLIPAHQKYSFIPDKQLKDLINKPFSFFDTVEVGEDVLLTEEDEDENEGIENEEVVSEQPETIVTHTEVENETTQPPAQEPEEPPSLDMPVEEIITNEEEENVEEKKENKKAPVFYFILFILLVGTLFAGYKYLFLKRPSEPQLVKLDTATESAGFISPDSVVLTNERVASVDSVEKKDTLQTITTEQEENKRAIDSQQHMTELGKVVIQTGDRLTAIARKYYGSKLFWVYIYQHNQSKIKNPDQIPIGTELSIPIPELYGIDSQNRESLAKAAALQEKILQK